MLNYYTAADPLRGLGLRNLFLRPQLRPATCKYFPNPLKRTSQSHENYVRPRQERASEGISSSIESFAFFAFLSDSIGRSAYLPNYEQLSYLEKHEILKHEILISANI